MIMTPADNLIKIDKDQSLTDAIRLMDKHRISRLMVTEDGEIIAIVTEDDIGERLGTGRERKLKTEHIHVSSAMNKNLRYLRIGPDETDTSPKEMRKIAHMMLENKFSSIPIKQGGEIIGLVTKTDLIKNLRDSRKQIKDIYTKNQVTLNPNDSLLHARKLMTENKIKRLIVRDRGFIAGILTERDIARGLNIFRRALDKFHHPDIKRLKVADVMTTDPITVSSGDTVGRVIDIMLEKNISGVPVIDPTPGVITKTDLVLGIASGYLP